MGRDPDCKCGKGGEEGIKPIKNPIIFVESIHEVNYSGDVCGSIHPAGHRPWDTDGTSAYLSSSCLRMAAKNALFFPFSKMGKWRTSRHKKHFWLMQGQVWSGQPEQNRRGWRPKMYQRGQEMVFNAPQGYFPLPTEVSKLCWSLSLSAEKTLTPMTVV